MAIRRLVCFTIGLAWLAGDSAPSAQAPSGPTRSVQDSVAYLRAVMDQYHNGFGVYEDVSSAGNHFHAYAKIPSGASPVTINGSWTALPHSGATAIRAEFTPSAPFGGFYFQNGTLTSTVPQPNFGDTPNAGVNLAGATALTFWARGERGGERLEFFVAGVGRNAATGAPTNPYPDSSPRRPAVGTLSTLSNAWQKFTIDLTSMDLSYVLGGFGWVASSAENPSGAVFFLDDIQYELSPASAAARLDLPRFLVSYTTEPRQSDPNDANRLDDIDFVLRNTAFTYDNALALLAFLAEGSSDSLRRARLIGDAFVYASAHDRYFTDNRACGSPTAPDAVNGSRLRTAYAAGDLILPNGWTPNGRVGTVASPGFYLEATQSFYEVEQNALDTGNNAWAMLALTALHSRTQAPAYLDTACKLGHFAATFKASAGAYQGFLGGTTDPETPSPTARAYASTEHNIDLFAAYSRLASAAPSVAWQPLADHARAFVESMWDSGRGCFLTGTTDVNTRNESVVPLDVQAWVVQAVATVLTTHPGVLACADANHALSTDGAEGFDFNDDKDGVWFEGTGQMAVSLAIAGRAADAAAARQELQRVQATAPLGKPGGLWAASRDALTTGFDFRYFKRLHIAATAWNVFAQLGFNPFVDSSPSPPLPPEGLGTTVAGSLVRLSWLPAPAANSYLLEVGSGAGLRDLFVGNIGSATALSANAPAGRYFIRLRSVGTLGVGYATDDAVAQVGSCQTPAAPSSLATTTQGSQFRLQWPPAPMANSYILEAGTAPALTDIASANVGARTRFGGVAPSVLYFVRVRAVNTCGAGPASPTLDLTISCSSLSTPSLSASVSGRTVTLQWTSVPSATSYLLEVGGTPSVNNMFVGNVGSSTTLVAPGVPSGSYLLRVRAVGVCGVGLPSSQTTVVVP